MVTVLLGLGSTLGIWSGPESGSINQDIIRDTIGDIAQIEDWSGSVSSSNSQGLHLLRQASPTRQSESLGGQPGGCLLRNIGVLLACPSPMLPVCSTPWYPPPLSRRGSLAASLSLLLKVVVLPHPVLLWSLGWLLVPLVKPLLPFFSRIPPTGRMPGYGSPSPGMGSVPGPPPGAGVGFRGSPTGPPPYLPRGKERMAPPTSPSQSIARAFPGLSLGCACFDEQHSGPF